MQGFVFGKTSHHPGQAAPLQPRFRSQQFLAFSRVKIAIELRKFQTVEQIRKM
jgi:hypothetical protein